jgi:hypothetical protein
MNSDLTRGWPLPCWLTLASLTTGGWFQAPLLSQSEVPTPTVRVSTHLVLVDAVVTDKQGKAISTDADSQEIMREMARETGGRAYVNQNEIKDGVERAFQDDSATYTLGYYPENKKYDGTYRHIKVKVKRDGLGVQNRRGYFAIEPSKIKDYNSDHEVASSLGDVLPSTLIAFTARVLPSSDNRNAQGEVGVDFLVDPSTVSVADFAMAKA